MCTCAHPHTHTHTLRHYNYFVYIKEFAQSFNPEMHLHCGPARYDRNGISVAHIILTALKKHYSLWKTERHIETTEEQWPLADMHKWESNGITFLCTSPGHSFINDLPTSFFSPYQVFFLSGKLQRTA